MKKMNKLMTALMALVMCLSLLPMSAFAADLNDYDEYRDWGPHEEVEPEQGDDAITEAIKNPLQEKVDKEAVEDGEDAANKLNDAAYDAVYGTTTDSDEHYKAADVAGGIPVEPEDGEDPVKPEPPKEDDSVLQNADKAADAAEAFQEAVTDAVTVEGEGGSKKTIDEVVGEVVRTDDGAIDANKSSGKALEIAQAAETAGTGAADAKQALEDAQAAVKNRDQPKLNEAKNQATEAYSSADTAFKTADAAYSTAKETVEAAQAAYDAAVAALEAAGYKLDGDDSEGSEDLQAIQAALSDAQSAVKTAQEQLAAAEKARNQAEMQRDYAKVYASVAAALGAEYDLNRMPQDGPLNEEWLKNPENIAMIKPLLDAMETLREVSEKTQYGEGENAVTRENLDLEELGIAYNLLYGAGDGYYDAWHDYYYKNWYTNEKRSEKAEAVKEIEKKYNIADGDQEDILYKVYKYAIDENAQKALSREEKALMDTIANGITGYWEIEKFLDHDKPADGQEGSWSALGEKTVTCKVGGQEYSVTLAESEDGGKSITVNGETYTPDSPEWNTYTALIRQQTAEQLRSSANSQLFAGTLHDVPKKIDGKYVYNYSKFDELKWELELKDPKGNLYPHSQRLVAYLDLLQYELPIRANEQKYMANKELYGSVVDQTSLMQMLLSVPSAGEAKLKELWDEAKQDPNSGIPEGMTFDDFVGLYEKLGAMQLAWELAYAADQDLEGNPAYDFMQHIISKKDEAEAAQKELDAAVEAYDKAAEAAEAAQARLASLLKEMADGKTQFAKAVEDAQKQLQAAKDALSKAETNKKSAETAQQEAQTAYEETMKLVIIITGGGFGFGDTDVTIDDQAVPLAAGPVTRAEFVDYLWRHEGEPASDGVCTFTDVAEDHEFVLALAWAEQNGIIEADADGAFQPDELVTVADVRAILGSFADVFGTNAVAAVDLTTLTGEDGETVLNCDQVLAEFFGEEYVLPEELDDLELDIAA